jgi:PAS domain S-box-containing protein
MQQPGFFLVKLLAAAAAVAAPLLLLTAYTLYGDHQSASNDAIQTVRAKSHDAATEVDEVLERAERLLTYVASRDEVRSASGPRCGEFIRGLETLGSPIANVAVAAINGDAICSSLRGPARPGVNVGQEPWFQLATAGDGFVLGKPLLGPLSHRQVVMLSLPVRDTGGRKTALVLVSLDLMQLEGLLSGAGLLRGGTLSLIDADSQFLFRAPDATKWVASSDQGANSLPPSLAQGGVFTARAVDGVERIFAATPTRHFDLQVVAGIPTEVVFAQSNALTRQGLTAAAIAALFAALVAYLTARALARPVRSLANTARAYAGGDNKARADESLPGEFGLLATEVNAMLMARTSSEARAKVSERAAIRLARFYRALSDTNQTIVRLTEPQELFETICRVCVDTGHASMAWLGLIRDGKLVPVAWGGPARDYTQSFEIERVSAILAGQAYVANDYMTDPRTLPWRDKAAPFGVRSAVAVPFRRGGVVVGALNLYADEAGFFDEQLVQLLHDMAADISFALDNFDRAAAHERAVLQVAKREAQLSGILESVLDAVITIDAGHRIVVFNQAAARMFGIPASEAVGQGIDRLIPVRFRGTHPRYVDGYVADGSGPKEMGPLRELSGLRSDGTEFPVVASISRTSHGGEVLMTVVVRDITGEREAERVRLAAAESEAANRAKTAFLSQMSHELRTPLNAVLGFTQLLQEDTKGRLTERDQHHLDLVFLAGAQLRALIDDVLDVSRIESGRLALSLREVDLKSLLNDVVRMSEAAARAGGIELRRTSADRPVSLRTDPVRLRQVMLNLLSNAIKYNRPGGSVSLDVETVHGGACITVADTGLGMSPEQLAGLFQPFNRLGRERSNIAGTGLGMSLVRQLVELLGGSIHVDSEVGAGTIVRVELPMAKRAEPLLDDPVAAATAAAQLTELDGNPSGVVLYIEDNEVNVLLVEQILSRWPDVKVVVAEDGESGIRQAKALLPDVVLLDMQLPDMSGLELLKVLQSDPKTRDLCVISLSGSAMEDEVRAAVAAGARHYWTKPIDVQPFLEGMREALERVSPAVK